MHVCVCVCMLLFCSSTFNRNQLTKIVSLPFNTIEFFLSLSLCLICWQTCFCCCCLFLLMSPLFFYKYILSQLNKQRVLAKKWRRQVVKKLVHQSKCVNNVRRYLWSTTFYYWFPFLAINCYYGEDLRTIQVCLSLKQWVLLCYICLLLQFFVKKTFFYQA